MAVTRGWGAAHLVRACAPRELRVEPIMERLNTGDCGFVENEIRLAEEAHGAIMRRHFDFDVNWRDAENSGLMLNTERLTVEECVDELYALLDDRTFQETAASRRIFADLSLTAHAWAALRQDVRASKLPRPTMAS